LALAGFALLTAVATLNLLTDSVFVAMRRTGYNAVLDGLVGGTAKLMAVVLLAGTGAYGLFLAATAGYVFSAVASLAVMAVVLRYRPVLDAPFTRLRPLLASSGANLAANTFNLLPNLVIPLIVLRGLGPEAAAYYYVAFQVAALLHSGVWAVEQSFLAEGAHAHHDWRTLLPRSFRVIAGFAVLGGAVLAVLAPVVLRLFGGAYSSNGAGVLIVLAVAVVPLAALSWLVTVLRLADRMIAVVVAEVVFAVSVCGLAAAQVGHGLTGVALAWPVGASLAAVTALVPAWSELRQRRSSAPRILIVTSYAAPHVGGVEVVVEQQARTLVDMGFEVTVVTSRCDRSESRHEAIDGYQVVRLSAWNGIEERLGVPFPVWGPAAPWHLLRLVLRADIVHVHDVLYVSSVLGSLAARLLGRPLFITQHVAMVEHDRAVVRWSQQLVYGTVGRLQWWLARRVTAYNPIVQEFLAGHGVPPAKVRLTYNGIDTHVFHPATDLSEVTATRQRFGLPANLPVVLFVGRLVPKKGFTKLMAAAGPQYRIALAGSGRIPDDVPEGVIFLGPVDRTDLPALYRACDVFAFPATGEMLTLSMQEAMASGLPVVTTSDPAYGAYGFDPDALALVDPEPANLRAVFEQILADPHRRNRMSGRARETALNRFDWRRNAEQLTADYLAVRRDPPMRHGVRKGRPPLRRDWRVLALVVVVLIAASLAVPQGRHQWALSLVEQPILSTTLAFTEPASIPRSLPAGGAVTVDFTISNAEGRATDYSYQIRQLDAAVPRVLSAGQRTVGDGNSARITATARPACTTTCELEVALIGRTEHLTLRLTSEAGDGG
jgi:glycosyltransferase involved in cell wall biosynthesis